MTVAQSRGRGWVWAFVPAALLTLMLVGQAVMIAAAVDDPSFSVERDYYRKAANWDLEREQRRQNALLGWKLDVALRPQTRGSELTVLLRDRAGRPITDATIVMDAFFNARAGEVIVATLERTLDGGYGALVPVHRAGLWEMRFSAERDGQRFTSVVRRDVTALP